MKEKKLTAAEEVFLIVRELNYNSGLTFSWQDWVDAYDSVKGPEVWSWQARDRSHRHVSMSAWTVLQRQIRHGTIEKLKRGAYMFRHLTPDRPFWSL